MVLTVLTGQRNSTRAKVLACSWAAWVGSQALLRSLDHHQERFSGGKSNKQTNERVLMKR